MRGEEIRCGIDIYPVQTEEEKAARGKTGQEAASLGESKKAATLEVGEKWHEVSLWSLSPPIVFGINDSVLPSVAVDGDARSRLSSCWLCEKGSSRGKDVGVAVPAAAQRL